MIVHEAVCAACGKREPAQCDRIGLESTKGYPVGWWLALEVREPVGPMVNPAGELEFPPLVRTPYVAFCSESCLRDGPRRATEPDIREL